MDEVFFALADPSRRAMLERLVQKSPQSTGELLQGLGTTRQGAARHLAVLERSGLVVSRRSGREVLRELKPQPLRGSLAWMAQLESAWDARLSRLATDYADSD
jgi:DNA-binding transcriptional ArsR family regulator